GGSCSVTIRFAPTAAASYNGNLAIVYTNGFTTITTNIAITGTGAPTSVLSFSSSSYDFGKIIQSQSSSKIITVNHSGPVPATDLSLNALLTPYSYKGGTYPGTGGNCSDTLNSGNCTIVIDFAPTTTGIKNHTFSLSYNNGTTLRTINALLTGESLAQAIISISETNPYNFGTSNLSASIDKTFTLFNSGSVSGTSMAGSFDTAVFSFKGGNFPGTGGTCTVTLAAGASCNIVLNFKPTQAITYNSIFTLSYHDGLRTQSELKTLIGTGSNSLHSEYYLTRLSDVPIQKSQMILVAGSKLWGKVSVKKWQIYKAQADHFFLQEVNHLVPLIEGLIIDQLNEDVNNDGTKDLLFSIHQNDSKLIGYSIRCGRHGQVLERFIIED
nr:choice-of-anchor D domain-containing protein [Bdellovibrionales bacterium]